MKQLDPEQVAKNIRNTVTYYLTEALEDQTSGLIRSAFEKALAIRGMDCIEITNKPARVLFDDTPLDGWTDGVVTLNEGKSAFRRILSLKYTEDLDELSIRGADTFVNKVIEAATAVANELPATATHASVPSLYVQVEAFHATWFLWGYFIEPYQKKE